MPRFSKILTALLTGIAVSGALFAAGCTKKPGTGMPDAEGATKVEEVRAAVEKLEMELGELRSERIRLEKELEAKKAEQK